MPRPKSGEAYEVLSCRVPQGLPARLTDHARLHRKRVRDVIVEALLVHLDGTQVVPLEAAADGMVRAALASLTEAERLLRRIPAVRRAPAKPPAVNVTPQPDNNGVDVTPQPDGTPAYDTEKYYLGKLCPKSHKWNGMDSTLRSIKGSKCLLCENEGKKKRREEQRAHAA